MASPIEDMVAARRAALARNDPARVARTGAPWGLALSGGGIRSATFCFGLIQALARNRLLLRFDLLSTVSGGGYIGAMLGRLFHRAKTPADAALIQERLGKREDIWLSWWLRANGRYLVPAGVRDKVYALAVYLRNLAGLHLELGIVGVAFGVVLACIDTLGWDLVSRLGPGLFRIGEPMLRDHFVWIPTPWLLLLPLLLAAATLCWAFWLVPRFAQSGAPRLLVASALVVACVLGEEAWRQGSATLAGWDWLQTRLPYVLPWVLAIVALSAFFAFLSAGWAVCVAVRHVRVNRQGKEAALARRDEDTGADAWTSTAMSSEQEAQTDLAKTQDLAVNKLTRWLANVIGAMGWIVAAGALDRLGWWLAFEYGMHRSTGYSLAVLMALLRVMLSPSSPLRDVVANSAALATLLSLAGRVMTFLLFGWWVGAIDRLALVDIFHADLRIVFLSAWTPLGVIFALVAIYTACTGTNTRFINLSSLHGFYRARLVRSYLGATNPWRFGARQEEKQPLGAIDYMSDCPADPLFDVADTEPHDDVLMTVYHPHANGGPVHLVNVCLNETTDPRGGLFNRDRRGRVLTVGPEGLLRVSQRPWQRIDKDLDDLTLGSWMAISGAAVSPGMGSNTRGGIPSLLMFAGARLGYWWDSHVIEGEKIDPSARWPRVARWFYWRRAPWIKLASLLRETFGRFGGPNKRDWFLTDGGHFENTGAYALLAEKTRLIVLADCGADPHYRFADVENLVRKARIDMQAEITFCRPTQTPPLPCDADMSQDEAEKCIRSHQLLSDLVRQFGSLNDLASDDSEACFALARIRYCRTSEQEHKEAPEASWLLLVKPNLCRGLPVDLFNFKDDHPAFPQQGTADQFFDEAQWESYFQLGRVLGDVLTEERLDGLLAYADRWFETDDGVRMSDAPATGSLAAPGAAAKPASSRLPPRFGTAGMSRTLGWSTAAAVAVGAWQSIETVNTSLDKQDRTRQDTLVELSNRWSDAQAASGTPEKASAAANALAAVLMRTSDRICASDPGGGWFNRSRLAVDLMGYAGHACEGPAGSATGSPCGRLLQALSSPRTDVHATCLVPFHTTDEREARKLNCLRYWGYDYRSHPVAICTPSANGVVSWTSSGDDRRASLFRPLPSLAASMPRDRTGHWRTPQAEACAGWSVVPMINTDLDRARALAFGQAVQAKGIDVAATLDVGAIDADTDVADDAPAGMATIKVFDAGALRCANALRKIGGDAAWRVEQREASPLDNDKVIEVRLAPSSAKATAPARPDSVP